MILLPLNEKTPKLSESTRGAVFVRRPKRFSGILNQPNAVTVADFENWLVVGTLAV